MKKSALLAAAVFGVFTIFAQQASAADPAVEQRVEDMLKQLTPSEKISLLGGTRDFYTRSVDRIKLPEFKMTDGPVGTRNDGKSTAYPADSLLAATWDPEIAKRVGVALARDAKSRGDRIVLGPAVNIYRVPQNGRNFEYMGEDPFLAGKICSAYITGMQFQGVAACVKHYACNNQETRRGDVNVIVDERTLQEIYLPAFEAAIKDGHARTVMCSYNCVNGPHASASKYLLTDVLRTQWGFDGLVMSDWGAVHDTLGPINAGLDLEMPGPKYLNEKAIQPLLDSGKVEMATIDEKVRRLLRVGIEMGWLESPAKDESIARDDDANNAVALDVAREGIILLKNEKSLLPLDKAKTKNVVVMGIGGDRYIGGGGSSYTNPARPITILAGLKEVAPDVNFVNVHANNWQDQSIASLARKSIYEPNASGAPALSAEYFNNKTLDGTPELKRDDPAINFDWKKDWPTKEKVGSAFSARWTGTIKPPTSGKYAFEIKSDDGSRVKLDGKEIISMWQDQAGETGSAIVDLEAGKTYNLVVEYYNSWGDANVRFGYTPIPPMISDEQRSALASADAAVVCVRTTDSEGSDRPYELSKDQLDYIEAAATANPKTIVVLESGGNVAMKNWIDRVPVLVDAMYPGQAGGKAIAEILFGDVNPSGHLPDTFEKDWTDSFAHDNFPGGDDVKYAEGIYVGYRYYDTKKIEPRFEFGRGLSYTTFEMKNPKVSSDKQNEFSVTVDVTNTGARAGATVAQLYVRPPQGEVDRPMQELKGFARVDLKPGETKTVSIPLDQRSFSYWDIASHNWKVQPGEYEIAIGQSSRDIGATTKVQVR